MSPLQRDNCLEYKASHILYSSYCHLYSSPVLSCLIEGSELQASFKLAWLLTFFLLIALWFRPQNNNCSCHVVTANSSSFEGMNCKTGIEQLGSYFGSCHSLTQSLSNKIHDILHHTCIIEYSAQVLHASKLMSFWTTLAVFKALQKWIKCITCFTSPVNGLWCVVCHQVSSAYSVPISDLGLCDYQWSQYASMLCIQSIIWSNEIYRRLYHQIGRKNHAVTRWAKTDAKISMPMELCACEYSRPLMLDYICYKI